MALTGGPGREERRYVLFRLRLPAPQQSDREAMPNLNDVWDLIGETKPQYFSVLDLASGF